MVDREKQQGPLGETDSKLPDYFKDPEGFLVAAFEYIESAVFPGRLKVPLAALNDFSYRCKQSDRIEDEAKLLALKTRALLKLAEMRAGGSPIVKICKYDYWDKDKSRVRQNVIFAIRMPRGNPYFSTEAPREKLGPEFDPYLVEFDQIPPGVFRRKFDWPVHMRKK